jgi:hypothetical protein
MRKLSRAVTVNAAQQMEFTLTYVGMIAIILNRSFSKQQPFDCVRLSTSSKVISIM